MDKLPGLMIFTDLDGTLLDHQTYDWSPAQEAIDVLKRSGAAVILASSKTAAEIAPLRAELDLEQWPAIVENGAGLLPANTAPQQNGLQYQALRGALASLPDTLRHSFLGFGDMSPDTLVDITGLSPQAAALARQRQFSEPGLWRGSAEDQQEFLTHLDRKGISARKGGRFLTLSFGADKAHLMRDLAQAHKARTTLALGDAPNDIEMLEAADYGIIIANPYSTPLPQLKGEAEGRITRTIDPGPEGWNSALLRFLADLPQTKG